jgi:hypothetical protein
MMARFSKYGQAVRDSDRLQEEAIREARARHERRLIVAAAVARELPQVAESMTRAADTALAEGLAAADAQHRDRMAAAGKHWFGIGQGEDAPAAVAWLGVG